MTVMNPVKSFGLVVAAQMQPYDPECPIRVGNHRYVRQQDLVPGLIFYRAMGSHAAAGDICPYVYLRPSKEAHPIPGLFIEVKPLAYSWADAYIEKLQGIVLRSIRDCGIMDNAHNQHRCFFTRKEAEVYLRETAMLNHIMGVRQPGHLDNWLGNIASKY